MDGVTRRWFVLGGGASLALALLAGFPGNGPTNDGRPDATFVVQ